MATKASYREYHLVAEFKLPYCLNGVLVNAAFEAKPSEGKTLLQAEGAEMSVRRYELWPLGQYKEE